MAATMLTSETAIPKLKNKVPNVPKKAIIRICNKVFFSGILNEIFEIFRLIALKIKIPNSIMKEVNMGPKTVTGILKRKNTIPHKKQLVKAYGMPLDILNRLDFFKSLKFKEINMMPITIKIIDAICSGDNDSLKKTIESITVNITEEFAIGETIPTFPTFNPFRKVANGM